MIAGGHHGPGDVRSAHASPELSSSRGETPPRRRTARFWIMLLVVFIAAAMLLFLAITSVRVARQAAVDETRRAGAIVVFGAAEYAGRPSPVFRARLDHAYELFQRGVAPIVITTGGAAQDPKFTEGGVGHDYLKRRGIPDANLIAETQSADTADSARRTATIMRANGIRDCTAVSDAYHMFRIKKLVEAEGIKVYAAPRPASIPHSAWGRLAAAVREAVSYLAWKLDLT
jgi:uncharacterized SAM-binding protein YcdF (DUF218 family)